VPAPTPAVVKAPKTKPAFRREEREEVEDELPPVVVQEAPRQASPANVVRADNVGRVVAVPAKRVWTGNSTGKMVWSGQLPPGGRIVLSTQRVAEGPGVLTSVDSMPPFTDVDITSITPYGRVTISALGPNALAIANSSDTPVNSIQIAWRVKQ
jgi:hypothetical protein